MDIVLSDVEARVLGCLMEKQLATPEYYPLSLIALTNACNQKSNREPVVDYDETTVADAAQSLAQKGLASQTAVGRVPKYEETFSRGPNFIARESAVMCLLLLRGPQTPGEIRGRSGRLCTFEDLAAVLETLNNLTEWGFVRRLARLPGHKEARYMHALGGAPDAGEDPGQGPRPPEATDTAAIAARIDRLEQTAAALEDEVQGLRAAFAAFKRQFE